MAATLLGANLALAGERIGVNFTDVADSADHLGPAETAGVGDFAQGHWNHVDGTVGTQGALVDHLGRAVPGLAVEWSCRNTWRATHGTGTPDQKLLKGYLDDTANPPEPAAPRVTFTGVPYPLYDVVLYLSSDTPASFDYGAYYLTDPDGNEATARVFGGDIPSFTGTFRRIPSDSTNGAVAAPGGNYIVFEGLDLPGFQVNGARTPVSRASLAAVQIVEDLLPRIHSFAADPPVIDPGQSSRLSWVVTHAQTLALNQDDVTGQDGRLVSPAETTTYSLVAANAEGARTARVTVAVRDLRPVIEQYVADPPAIDRGGASTLRWSVANAARLTVDGTEVSGTGALTVRPAADADYPLVAANAFGVRTASVSVTVVNGVGHPVISEFMALNRETVADADGDHPDWIEIHNPTDGPIDLAGYALTDDPARPGLWHLPSVIVPAGGYLVVFASEKPHPLHASFALRGEGEYLALLDPDGQILHAFSPAYPGQSADISYGILGSDPTRTLFMGIPTPGAPNQLVPPPADPVAFSPADQVFSEGPLHLTLSTATPGGMIRYTTNGTAPSPTNGIPYQSALAITNSVVVRAVAYSATRPAGRVGAGHYLKLGADVQGFHSPLPILVLDNFGAGPIPNKGFTQTMAGIVQQPRQGAALVLFDREHDGIACVSSTPALFTRAGVRVRGSYSSTFAWPPYSVEAWDGDDQPAEMAPLGLPPESDWILYRPREDIDVTLLYNTWIYELSNQLGHYAARTRFVEGFVHTGGGELTMADRAGVYVLMEKVKRDRNRLDFEPLAEDGSAGGWLLAINRLDPIPVGGVGTPRNFHTAGQDRVLETPPDQPGQGDDEPRQYNAFINFEHPNGYEILPAQRAAIESWFVPFEDALWSAAYRDPVAGYRRHLDTADFIDYYILHNITKNGDGLLLSLWLYLEHPRAKLKMGPVWDYDLLAYRGDPTADLRHHSDRLWYGRLFTDIDFQQEYVDRWQMHRRGVLANSNLVALVDRQATEITAPVAAAHGVVNWPGNLASMKNWVVARCDAIDAQFVPPPQLNQAGGAVPVGFEAVLSAPRGEICYTLDGSDPRAPGGGLSPAAGVGPAGTRPVFTVPAITRVVARARDGNQWSGPVDQTFYPDAVAADAGNLAISEIHYHPRPLDPDEAAAGVTDASDFEFIELVNIGQRIVLLDEVAFTDGVEFTFAAGTVGALSPGEYAVVVGNPASFGIRYPTAPTGRIAGGFAPDTRLDNAGERMTVVAAGTVLHDFAYDDDSPWPTAPDGQGRTLTLVAPATAPDPADPASWRSSGARDGTPGSSDARAYADWKSLHGIASDTGDDDSDGLTGFAEYAHGTDPAVPDAPAAALQPRAPGEAGADGAPEHLFACVPHALAADDAVFAIEHTTRLGDGEWSAADDIFEYAGEQAVGDTTALRAYRTRQPAAAFTNLFLRLRLRPR